MHKLISVNATYSAEDQVFAVVEPPTFGHIFFSLQKFHDYIPGGGPRIPPGPYAPGIGPPIEGPRGGFIRGLIGPMPGGPP